MCVIGKTWYWLDLEHYGSSDKSNVVLLSYLPPKFRLWTRLCLGTPYLRVVKVKPATWASRNPSYSSRFASLRKNTVAWTPWPHLHMWDAGSPEVVQIANMCILWGLPLDWRFGHKKCGWLCRHRREGKAPSPPASASRLAALWGSVCNKPNVNSTSK